MKKTILLLIFSLLLFKSTGLYADDFSITIGITEGEKSKDSWSSETSISIVGTNITYSKSYSGSRKDKNKTKDRACSLTYSQIDSIKKLIKDGNLLVSATIEDENSKYKNFERFVNLSADIIMEERVSRIRINGDVSSMDDKELYKNVYALVSLIEEYIDKCN